MEVFVDTNVWIASLIARGTCSDLIEHLIAQHEIRTSGRALDEVERVLSEKFGYADQRVGDVLDWLGDIALEVETPEEPPETSVDPDDDYILHAALEAEVDILVTGDDDLLELDPDVDANVVEPSAFWREE